MFFDSVCNHQIKISEYRYTCGFSGENFLSVVLTRDTVKELLLQIKNLDANTVNFRLAQKGLKVHISRAHPEVHNVNLKEKKVFA